MSVVLPAERLMKVLGYSFQEPQRLKQALTHRSYSSTHNERLEFVGDSILNAVIARTLFLAFPQLTEGELSRLRASLVRQEALAEVASELQLGDYLSLGEGELKSGGHRRPSILADALEAIFGAIWFDGGFAEAERVITALFASRVAKIDPAQALKDPKTGLQEWLQARRQPLPEYVLARQDGESPNQVFEVVCLVRGLQVEARAEGPSRRNAEQQAAAAALALLRERHPGKRL
ncbi:ribonuclease III [Jeongeupia naejangsanensis]|uniref:Ribonuclease 3 n=1 Tax=Jeongeupia naejangsanensis TaxID=613195 RepID=A0ABS2BIT8_9NEIS|nr:ribonuclease III [Jeongeupia naejangsanensis]MBM3115518.1 ribonuclease III [Jeongeupia naejangsanensis]